MRQSLCLFFCSTYGKTNFSFHFSLNPPRAFPLHYFHSNLWTTNNTFLQSALLGGVQSPPLLGCHHIPVLRRRDTVSQSCTSPPRTCPSYPHIFLGPPLFAQDIV